MTTSSSRVSKPGMLKRLRNEPAVVFMLLTAAIFALDAITPEPEQSAEMQPVALSAPATDLSVIEVPDSLVASLQEEFSWLQGRQPDAAETEMLVANWVQDEMIFRHALLQDLHRGDSKVREQLVQKISLLWAGLPAEPGQDEVLAYYMDNIDRYYSEPQVSFSQVFFEQSPQDTDDILQRLQSGERIAGDGFWTGDEINGYGESIMRTSFGGEFYTALLASPFERWVGPLRSARGFHFINLHAVTEPAPLAFADIYNRVRSDVIGSKQARRIEAQIELIETGFTVRRESIND